MNKMFLKTNVLLVMALILSGCGSYFQSVSTSTPTLDPDNPEITISLDEFTFTPDHVRLVVGQNVTLHVVNNGEEPHEIMIGRNPLRSSDGVLGDGFEHDFFALTDVSVTGNAEVMGMKGEGMSMDMGTSMPEDSSGMQMATATPEGMMDMGTAMPEGEMNMDSEMENGGMVMLDAKKEAVITFKVTKEMVGAWTMGCFEGGDLKHFDLGMAGILYVRDLSN
ncbi:MAG: hypothetical protein FIB03_03630 [Anaerolineae bacterium]|nr:hypothetical protein [Anaerolineae bacterium]